MRRTKRGGWPYSQPPNVQFEINRDSPQADGLVLWMPWGGGTPGAHRHVDRVTGLVFTEGGTPVWVAKRGWSMLFDDAANEYLTSDAIVTAAPFSMCARFYNDGPVGNQVILSFADSATANNRILLYINAVPRLYLFTQDAGGTSQTDAIDVVADSWHFACGIVDADLDLHCWYDTTKEFTLAARVPASVDRMCIGCSAESGLGLYWSGYLTDVRVYNRELADAEVRQIIAEPWELWRPQIPWALTKPPIIVRIPRHGFTNYQVPGIV